MSTYSNKSIKKRSLLDFEFLGSFHSEFLNGDLQGGGFFSFSKRTALCSSHFILTLTVSDFWFTDGFCGSISSFPCNSTLPIFYYFIVLNKIFFSY